VNTTVIELKSENQDFRLFLQQELVKRCKLNPSYSLRAFAKMLQIEPSALSKLLNGKRTITPPMFKKLAHRLGLNPSECKRYESHLKNDLQKDIATPSYQQLTLDAFQVIADWYHYAILELTHVQGFVSNPKWVAKALGISVTEVNAALERLVRLEFLEITEDSKWVDRSGSITTVGNEFTAVAFRKLQKQVLEKALVALEEIPMDLRDQTSMTMAIDSELLPEAKKRITDFRRKLCSFLQSGKKKDQVYQLGVSLYPLTNLEKGEKK
jgi:uncharacterized protein (TIGR02147 family)